jgi:hypothetical protein
VRLGILVRTATELARLGDRLGNRVARLRRDFHGRLEQLLLDAVVVTRGFAEDLRVA